MHQWYIIINGFSVILVMTISKFLDPKNDLSFRRVFGTEKNKNILIHFINDILGLTDEDAIQEVEFLGTIMVPEIASDKQSVVDILCKDSAGRRFVVEMQVARDKSFQQRAQLYAAQAYSRQLDKSGNYIDLKTVYFIAVSNCNLFPEDVDYISTHNIRELRTNGHYLKDLQFIFIELPKFSKTKVEELENTIERWCYFFSATWKVMVLWWLNSIFPDIRDNVYLTFQRVATSGMQA